MNSTARFFAIFVLSLLPFVPLSTSNSQSKPETYYVRAEDSRVGFTIMKWLVFKEEGRFKTVSGTIQYDPQIPSATSVDMRIDVASVDSRNSGRDNAIRSEDFLNAAKYPVLTFKSTGAQVQDKDHLLVTGDLSIKGVTKRVTVPVKLLGVAQVHELGSLAGFETSFTVQRSDFGVAPRMKVLGEEVVVDLQIGAVTNERMANR